MVVSERMKCMKHHRLPSGWIFDFSSVPRWSFQQWYIGVDIYIVVRCSRHSCIALEISEFWERRTERTKRTRTINFQPTANFGMLRNDAACSFRYGKTEAQTHIYVVIGKYGRFDHRATAQLCILSTRHTYISMNFNEHSDIDQNTAQKLLSSEPNWVLIIFLNFFGGHSPPSHISIDFLFVIWNAG